MARTFLRLTPCAGLAASALAAGCGGSGPAPPARAGGKVTVHFRRDALGMAAALPVPPSPGGINGAEVTMTGTLVRQDSARIVLADGDRESPIPLGVVLVVESHAR